MTILKVVWPYVILYFQGFEIRQRYFINSHPYMDESQGDNSDVALTGLHAWDRPNPETQCFTNVLPPPPRATGGKGKPGGDLLWPGGEPGGLVLPGLSKVTYKGASERRHRRGGCGTVLPQQHS